ncbi:MAG: hypothetical protein ACR2PL_01780 [Dehalococcoidia bacterium]
MIDRGAQAGRCACCREALDSINTAVCDTCGRPFHLILRTDVPGKDCGQVWIGTESQGLEFGCNRCLGRQPASPAQEPPARRYRRHEDSDVRAVARRRQVRRRDGG